jgi:hypothetical protein
MHQPHAAEGCCGTRVYSCTARCHLAIPAPGRCRCRPGVSFVQRREAVCALLGRPRACWHCGGGPACVHVQVRGQRYTPVRQAVGRAGLHAGLQRVLPAPQSAPPPNAAGASCCSRCCGKAAHQHHPHPLRHQCCLGTHTAAVPTHMRVCFMCTQPDCRRGLGADPACIRHAQGQRAAQPRDGRAD